MKDDPIVNEVRKAREEYAASLGFDLAAMIADARQKTQAAKERGRPVASFAPRSPRPHLAKASA